MDKVKIGTMEFRADCVPVCGAKLLVIQGQHGMLGCGYFNLATADKLGHALAIVSGVSCYDVMLLNSIQRRWVVPSGNSGGRAGKFSLSMPVDIS